MAQPAKGTEPPLPLRRNRVGPVGSGANAAALTAFARAGFLDPTLVLRWEDIAGAETARLARPIKFTEGPSGGTLTLKAEPGAALFLQHETRALTERINGFLGRTAVSRLRFVHGALTTRPAIKRRPTVVISVAAGDPANRYRGPESLRNALLKLAEARLKPPPEDRV